MLELLDKKYEGAITSEPTTLRVDGKATKLKLFIDTLESSGVSEKTAINRFSKFVRDNDMIELINN